MNSNDKLGFYFGISDTKIYICFFDDEKKKIKNVVQFEIPGNINNNLNFKVILNLLQKNIRKLEKQLGIYLNSGNISVQSKTYQSILFSVKNIFDEKKLDKEVITKIVRSGIQQIYNNDQNLNILHVIIKKYIIDDKVYVFFPKNIKFKKIILEIEFICLDKNFIDKIKNLFNNCKIKVKNIVSYDYATRYLNDVKDDTMCLSAKKILEGLNRSEVVLIEDTSKNKGLFDKVFNFFD